MPIWDFFLIYSFSGKKLRDDRFIRTVGPIKCIRSKQTMIEGIIQMLMKFPLLDAASLAING